MPTLELHLIICVTLILVGWIGFHIYEVKPIADETLIESIPQGFPTSTVDITGTVIVVGDVVGYDFPDDDTWFEVIYEENAVRKAYPRWDQSLPNPVLESGPTAERLRFKILKPYYNGQGKKPGVCACQPGSR